MRSIELLAPAKDLECGMAAIEHGADAVYIGANMFGARAAAGNSIEDIKLLCDYAHAFAAKVYVTINTIVYDNELEQLQKLLGEVVNAGVDAILVQDMAVLSIIGQHAKIALHASTQTDNRNAEKVEWLHDMGFSRVVLARELSLKEIADVHKKVPDVELEAFVHGALCVSYSGACYASQHCFGRSANRGECAQFCRLKFDLEDKTGKVLLKNQYPISLKDMCRINDIEALVDAGVTSLKIEGRLKNANYVKNVVAAYNQELNRIIRQHPDKYRRASLGKVEYTFEPNLSKSFNRGFTDYFMHGRNAKLSSMHTPKALGENVGKVKEIDKKSFTVAGTTPFANGDGLCFVNNDMLLEGFRVNKVVNNRLFPTTMPSALRRGMKLYRNNDQCFEKILSKKSATRKIDLTASLTYREGILTLSLQDESRLTVDETIKIELEKAQKPQAENIERQLTKLGNTIYTCTSVSIDSSVSELFIPSTILADLRRRAVEKLTSERCSRHVTEVKDNNLPTKVAPQHADDINIANVSNRVARAFYTENGIADAPKAFELNGKNSERKPIMTCRYCLKNELGCCVKHGGTTPTWKEPLQLRSADGRTFTIEFECRKCQMKIYANN